MLPNTNQQQMPVQQNNTQSVVSTQSLRISDILLILVSNWYWILLCVILGYGAANLYLRKTRPVFTRKASILLKDMNKSNILGTSAYGYSDASLLIQSVDLTNEIFTIKSPVVMTEVIRRLNLQMQYEIAGAFRNSVLYGSNLPIDVKMLEAKDQESSSVTIVFDGDSTFVLSNFIRNGQIFEGTSLSGQLGRTLSTPIGNIVVTSTPYYYKSLRPIVVTHLRAQAALSKFSNELKVRSEAGSTIINLEVNDNDIQRAEEILYSVIAIYNEQWMDDRNQVSISTNQFISERLNVIENELGNVDSNISDYKSDNLIIGNAESMAGMYVSQAQSANTQLVSLNNQLYLARSLRSYLTNESNFSQLLPASQGLSNASITGQISQYNSLLMRRNNLVSASSLENPIVKDLDAQLEALRMTMISSIDNHIDEINLYMISFIVFTVIKGYEYLGLLALVITVAIVLTMGILYSAKIIKVTKKFRMVMLSLFVTMISVSIISFLGYLIPFTRPFVASILGNFWISLGLTIISIIIASLFLITDFATIDHVVTNKLPAKYEWSAAFGLAFTVLWIYVKILDLLIQIVGHSKN